jgi:hypothetical protein
MLVHFFVAHQFYEDACQTATVRVLVIRLCCNDSLLFDDGLKTIFLYCLYLKVQFFRPIPQGDVLEFFSYVCIPSMHTGVSN